MKLSILHSLVCLLLVVSCATSQVKSPPPTQAKNVIVMISDGTGWYSWDAGLYFRNGKLGQEDFENFPVRLPITTFPLTTDGQNGSPNGRYDPSKAWNDKPIPGDEKFAGYKYIMDWATDSAAAATAMATGVKTFNGALGVDVHGQPVPNLTELAIALGKSAGVITSVPLSHATPAGFVAHSGSRGSYRAIAQQMLQSRLSVVMGAGNPLDAKEAEKYDYVGGKSAWRWLKSGKSPWTLLQTREQFEKLAAGADVPDRVFGVPLADSKLPNTHEPGADRVPTLATMSRGALNVLSRNPNGFFLMIEGGAPDWASHNNKLDDMINELGDFYDAVDAVVQWIEAHGGWQQNLLIVTTDHGNGLLLGPDSDKVFWQPVTSSGKGNLPAAKFHTKGHTNDPVRLYANGAGAGYFLQLADKQDPGLHRYHPGWGPKYGDDTHIFKVAYRALAGDRPLPAVAPPAVPEAEVSEEAATPAPPTTTAPAPAPAAAH